MRVDILGSERGRQSLHESAAAVMRGNVVGRGHSILMIVRRKLWIHQWWSRSTAAYAVFRIREVLAERGNIERQRAEKSAFGMPQRGAVQRQKN